MTDDEIAQAKAYFAQNVKRINRSTDEMREGMDRILREQAKVRTLRPARQKEGNDE